MAIKRTVETDVYCDICGEWITGWKFNDTGVSKIWAAAFVREKGCTVGKKVICREFLTPEKALEYGLIDRVDSYQADDKDVQQRLMSRVQQLSGVIAQQKSFREQLESMRQQGGELKPPVPTPKPEPEEKKLTNQLAKLFQNM